MNKKMFIADEEKFQSLVKVTSDWVWEIDNNFQYTYASSRVVDIMGYQPKQIMGRVIFDFMTEPDKKINKSELEKLYGNQKPFYCEEHTMLHKDGREVALETSCVPCFSTTSKLLGYRGISRDISRRKEDEAIILLSERVFENIIEGIVVTDAKGIIQRVNQAFTDITGYSAKEVLGRNPSILKSNRHDNAFYHAMWQSLLQTGQWDGEIWNRRKDGSAYPEWLSISSIRNEAGQITRFVSLFHDISEKKNSEQEFKHLAFHDPLTSLPNRKLFYDRAEVSIKNAIRTDEKIALLYMDIDDFKNINASYGHPLGDELLCLVKERIESVCRDSDTFARYGGDEFIIILNNVHDSHEVSHFSERIIQLFEKPFMLMGKEIHTSISIGISIFPDDGKDIITLEKNADMALGEAKKIGKKCSFLFKHNLKEKMLRKTYLENKLRSAIVDFESFEVYYQPKVDLRTNKIHSVEALLRWTLEGESISPVEFIPIAEDTNMILPVGEWLMEKTMTDMQRLHESGRGDISLSINLSAKQFNDEKLFDTIGNIIKLTDFNPAQLCFEITESIPMKNIDASIEIMEKINRLGIKLSMDDFGTGYSSLAYLKKFPLKELKIDRSFIKDLPGSSDDAAISKTIIQMAKSLNFEVVAEGVEIPEQLEFLEKNGCYIIQGYLFYKPLTYSNLNHALNHSYNEQKETVK